LSQQRSAIPLTQIKWTTEVYPGLGAEVHYAENPQSPYDGMVGHLVFLTHEFVAWETGHMCAWVKVLDDLLDPQIPWYVQQYLVERRKMIRLKDYEVRRPYRQRSKKPPLMGRLYVW
jgi:hypothetical protein